ncbi:UbiX family flavin prenyltransferase [Neorhizobium galegae]|uniref:UbiX family flavin prenyltransferase n=1 Tax=Neorhizobium galegae TaxID=399 RepID=UPI00062248FF|nr:UbiX family flavin prenyltransferase [Neorhizobium galegae]CDZ60147.1 3-octaprenyl-4-hydroxybenzoate decarboxylase together with UbiG [Neorhizobium galegae bv. orientalis]KAB1121014.1 UbiX family flavin prenyltransferase [Neorhizobium galegae]MCQ1574573.1 UbiX family flavin prenyltransferase [Neorhizobium galegae]MCQ1810254.1 UbiX family flavin prenyltransferase [Neorhizobium galegae]CDZ64700.1 3-octaprenyl-4-hydroxybenzoate decarboxylase together with UbiG [Neorhizobium galegae bv. orienta
MRRIIIAITGASGVVYGVRALQLLRQVEDIETHAVISPSAFRTAIDEIDMSAEEIKSLADVLYNHKDIGAALSSGSFRTAGMLVAPCSVKTLSGIANCYNDELIVRAADVCLKERRRVVLLFRETPLHAGHIALMDQATRNGAIVMPPVPAFYSKPQSLDEMVTQTVGRALDLFDIHLPMVKRWKDGPGSPGQH